MRARAVGMSWSNTAMSDASGTTPEGPGPDRQHQPPVYGVPPSGPMPTAPPPYGQAPYAPTPHHHNPYGVPSHGNPGFGGPLRDPNARPGTVLAAGIVTLISTGLVLLLLVVILFFMLVARADFMDGFGDEAGMSNSDADNWFAGILVLLLVFIVWCLAAIVLAILAMRRSNVARIMLVVSSAVTAALSLVAITSGVSIVTLGAAIAVIVCLFTGGAGDWFHREHLYSPPKLPPL